MESTQMCQRRGLKRKLEEDEWPETAPQDHPIKFMRGYFENQYINQYNVIPSVREVQEKTNALIQKYGSPRSSDDEYEILKFLGEGSFGKVAKCLKKGSNEIVALKICKDPKMSAFHNECSILRQLNAEDPEKFNFVRNVENFVFEQQFFMAFEMLDMSLFDYLKGNEYRPLPMEAIRYITRQLLIAQNKLRELKIIHGDLKPENIMLVKDSRNLFNIKIIDFGLSIRRPTRIYPLRLGTRIYRAPEITLGLSYYEAVDMWSTGCIVAEMLIGAVLYPGFSSYDQIRMIDETQGPFPTYMMKSTKVAGEYFCRERRRRNGSTEYIWRLKSPEEYRKQTGVKSYDARKYPLKDLDDLLQVCSRVRGSYDNELEDLDRRCCVAMIREMLELNHEDRIFPDEALKCRFIMRGMKSGN